MNRQGKTPFFCAPFLGIILVESMGIALRGHKGRAFSALLSLFVYSSYSSVVIVYISLVSDSPYFYFIFPMCWIVR